MLRLNGPKRNARTPGMPQFDAGNIPGLDSHCETEIAKL
jgi:hypothetical protein